MLVKINRINPKELASMGAALSLVLYLIWLPVALVQVALESRHLSQIFLLLLVAIFLAALVPLIGWLLFAFLGMAYNYIAKRWGGVTIELSNLPVFDTTKNGPPKNQVQPQAVPGTAPNVEVSQV